MLKRILTQKRYLKNIYKDQKGITGLETAIILIAFVVVAAVFAYTVLSAGLFSTQKSQEAVYSGLQETQNTLVVKGGVLSQADSKAAEACDDAALFTDGTDGTVADETTIIHQGAGSIKITSAADGVDQLLGYKTAAITVAQNDTITFWAKINDAALYTDKLGFAIDALSTGINSTSTTKVNITAADTSWHLYSVDVAVGEVGAMLFGVYARAAAVGDVFIDDIQVNNVSLWDSTKSWTPYSSAIILTLALASGGQPVDFSPGNTSSGGLWTGLSKTNKMVVNYNDNYSHFTDVVWGGSFIGNSNGDYMLDPGEKIKLTISLEAVNAGSNKLDANHQFTLELKTPKGAILALQRTMPARLYGIDNLN